MKYEKTKELWSYRQVVSPARLREKYRQDKRVTTIFSEEPYLERLQC